MGKKKADKAFDAMKALGIASDLVKPVLKQLLKLYANKWEFIEAENYRALVDAIFECKEEKEDERFKVKMIEPVDCTGVEPSRKKQKKLQAVPEDDALSVVDSDEILEVCKEGGNPPIPHSNGILDDSNLSLVNKEVEPAIDKGKDQLSPNMITSEKIRLDRTSSSLCLPVDESISFQIPLRDNSSNIQIDRVEGSSIGKVSEKLSQCVDNEITKECVFALNLRRSEHKIDIVSLPSRGVKLCCVFEFGNVTSYAPDMDSILKLVEQEFVRSHKIIGPPFSLRSLLKDICHRSYELTSDCASQSLVRTSRKVRTIEIQEAEPENETTLVLQKNQLQLYVDDITKGQENVKISLVDEHGNSKHPNFFYIPRNIVYQKAIVNISLARISDEDCCPRCSGDCLSSPVPCACTRVTNGEYAYTKDGLVNSEFLRASISDNNYVYCQDCPIARAKNKTKPEKCLGHAVKKFIKECWSKCGCNLQCGNRVVQQGITHNLQVFRTARGKGWGLRTLEDLPQGAFVCVYVGEIVTNTELDERNKRRRGKEKHTYPVQLDADWGSESMLNDDFALCLDATYYGNVARFINHRCGDANLIEIPVEVETADHHYYHLAFFTAQEVKAFEELTWDYGIDFDDDNHPIKAFQCKCGSSLCRDKPRKGMPSRSKSRGSHFN